LKLVEYDPPCHECAAHDRRTTHIFTGDPDFDHSIEMCANRDLPARLSIYLSPVATAYRPRNAYTGGAYYGYHGDD
jgi:hypothetical protein